MPTDRALADALAAAYTPAELAALHQRLVEELDHADDIADDDPLGRLCDATFLAAYPTRPATTKG
ncbi:hypothetical protein ACQSSU_12740 [Micromonospora echinospora]